MAKPNPEWLCSDYPELKGNVGQAAVNDQLVHYPQVVRSDIDVSIDNQNFGIVALNLLTEPKTISVNGQKTRVYGFLKLRGNWSDVNQTESKAAAIVRTQDSKNKNRIAPVGHWVPICDSECLTRKVVSVSDESESIEHQKVQDQLTRKNAKGQAQYERELKEREEELKNAGDPNDDPHSLDFYTMKRVLSQRLDENIQQFQEKLDKLMASRAKNNDMIYALDQITPTHASHWIDNLNAARRKVGIPDCTLNEKLANFHETYVSEPEVLEKTLQEIAELKVKMEKEVARAKRRENGDYDSSDEDE